MLGEMSYHRDENITHEMMAYYNERAQEYDEIYRGKGHVTLDSSVYQQDVMKTSEMASSFGKGHLIDIACGTGFWLPNYARNCRKITLLDQSEKMLNKCKIRVEQLGLIKLTNFIQGEFFEVKLEPSTFDSALVGFLLSHFTFEQENSFFLKLRRILKPNSQLMVIDSAWNKERQKYSMKEGTQERVLNDERRFKIFKRYFEQSDIENMADRYDFTIRSYYIGKAFIVAILERRST